MKQKLKLILFLACTGVLITASLYAGRHAYSHCDKCQHDFSKKDSQTNILTGLFKSYPTGIKP